MVQFEKSIKEWCWTVLALDQARIKMKGFCFADLHFFEARVVWIEEKVVFAWSNDAGNLEDDGAL